MRENSNIADNIPIDDPDFLVKVLTQADAEKDAPRVGEYLHLSSLLKTECPRALFLRQLVVDASHAGSSVNSASRVVWAIGRGIELHVKTQLITALGAANVLGKWVCKCGSSSMEGFFDTELSCRRCSLPMDQYEELSLVDHVRQITGHGDLLFRRDGKIYPVECKSIKKEGFEQLKPSNIPPDYKRQLFGYGVLLKKNKFPVGDKGFLLFVNKDFTWEGTPYKVFPLPFVAGPEQRTLKTLFSLAEKIKEARQLKAAGENILPLLPSRLDVCTGSRTPTAKRCEVCSYCFLYDNNRT